MRVCRTRRGELLGKQRSRGGFTLLELVFAMLVFAILLGIGVAGTQYLWKGDEVESSARQMQSVMMRAMRMSVANQKPYVVVLDPERVRLMGESDVHELNDSDDDGSVVEHIEQKTITPGVKVFVRRWKEQDWRSLESEVLNFPVSGICEPVAFRLLYKSDMLEFTLHPLTAYPTDETLLVQ